MAKELSQELETKGKKLQSRIWFFSLVESENDMKLIFENLKHCAAAQVFAIRHDKDRIRQDDGTTIPKRPHWHFALRFETPYLVGTVANIFNLQPCDYHLVQKAKNFKASCKYMLHLENKEKHLYDIKELITIKGEKDDFYNITIGKAQYITSDADLFPNFGDFDKESYKLQFRNIYDNIDEPKRRNLLLKELETSWKNYLQKRKYEMETKNVKVIFIEGKAGSGKSTFAKNLAVNQKKSYCVSSSSNDVLQDYTCEDYLILDDLRDDTFSFVDLLKLLDNFVISSVKSRYSNKLFLGEYIVITSAKPLYEWYLGTTEERQQLFRRISLFVKCRKVGNKLISDYYIHDENEPAIDEFGHPIGNVISAPIMELTPKMQKSAKSLWKEMGVDLEALETPEEIVDAVYQNIDKL